MVLLNELKQFFLHKTCDVALENTLPLSSLKRIFGHPNFAKHFQLKEVDNTYVLSEITEETAQKYQLTLDPNANNPFGAKVYLKKYFEFNPVAMERAASAFSKKVSAVVLTGNVALLSDSPFMLYHTDLAFAMLLDAVTGSQELDVSGDLPSIEDQLQRAWASSIKPKEGLVTPVAADGGILYAFIQWDVNTNNLRGMWLSETESGTTSTPFRIVSRANGIEIHTERQKQPIDKKTYYQAIAGTKKSFSPPTHAIEEKTKAVVSPFTEEKSKAIKENEIVLDALKIISKMNVNSEALIKSKLIKTFERISSNNERARQLVANAAEKANWSNKLKDFVTKLKGLLPRNDWIDYKNALVDSVAAALLDRQPSCMVSKDKSRVIYPIGDTSYTVVFKGGNDSGVVTISEAPVAGVEAEPFATLLLDKASLGIDAQSRSTFYVSLIGELISKEIDEHYNAAHKPTVIVPPENEAVVSKIASETAVATVSFTSEERETLTRLVEAKRLVISPAHLGRTVVGCLKPRGVLLYENGQYGRGIADDFNQLTPLDIGLYLSSSDKNVISSQTALKEAASGFEFLAKPDDVKQQRFFQHALKKAGIANAETPSSLDKLTQFFVEVYNPDLQWEGDTGFESQDFAMDSAFELLKSKAHLSGVPISLLETAWLAALSE